MKTVKPKWKHYNRGLVFNSKCMQCINTKVIISNHSYNLSNSFFFLSKLYEALRKWTMPQSVGKVNTTLRETLVYYKHASKIHSNEYFFRKYIHIYISEDRMLLKWIFEVIGLGIGQRYKYTSLVLKGESIPRCSKRDEETHQQFNIDICITKSNMKISNFLTISETLLV